MRCRVRILVSLRAKQHLKRNFQVQSPIFNQVEEKNTFSSFKPFLRQFMTVAKQGEEQITTGLCLRMAEMVRIEPCLAAQFGDDAKLGRSFSTSEI